MATTQPTLTDPDKFGLLINLRQKMDELKPDKLYTYSQSILQLLSVKQLKAFVFVGLNANKSDIEYSQLSQMKACISEMIEREKKSKKKCESKPAKDTDSKSKPTIPIIPKNASLTKVIPFDIISNYICHFLKMSSITKLAECDRKLAIICHTPTSIKNLMHRYDPYPYIKYRETTIDGYYYNMTKWTPQTMHRFTNIEQLSISFRFLEESFRFLEEDRVEIFNSFKKIKHLSLHHSEGYDYKWSEMRIMHLLESLCIQGYDYTDCMLDFIDKYHSKHKLKSIAFIYDSFGSLEDNGVFPEDYPETYEHYKNMTDFLLPPQPNSVEILKFEHSFFIKSDETECKDTNAEYSNIERISSSLLNLKGFVYSHSDYDDNDNIFYNLAQTILSNLVLFKQLNSLHTHSNILLSLYLNNTTTTALNNISELCISVDLGQLYSIHATNALKMLNLEKLCLAINIRDSVTIRLSKYETLFKSVFLNQRNLRLLQIVTVFSDETNTNVKHCEKSIQIVSDLISKLFDVLNGIQNRYDYSTAHSKKPLLFKFHMKSAHSIAKPKCSTYAIPIETSKTLGNLVQNTIVKYLMTYPLGKIQFKISHNVSGHHWIASRLKMYLKGLNQLFSVIIKEGGSLRHLRDNIAYCDSDMDCQQYAISVNSKHNLSEQNVDHDRKWKVDCQYCCNTPWV